MMSKVHLYNLTQLRETLGIAGIHRYGFMEANAELNTELTSVSWLKQFGYLEGPGCPAGHKESNSCKDFLEAKGIAVRRTLVHEVVERVQEDFLERFDIHYGALTPKNACPHQH
jgi:hypothetical protein